MNDLNNDNTEKNKTTPQGSGSRRSSNNPSLEKTRSQSEALYNNEETLDFFRNLSEYTGQIDSTQENINDEDRSESSINTQNEGDFLKSQSPSDIRMNDSYFEMNPKTSQPLRNTTKPSSYQDHENLGNRTESTTRSTRQTDFRESAPYESVNPNSRSTRQTESRKSDPYESNKPSIKSTRQTDFRESAPYESNKPSIKSARQTESRKSDPYESNKPSIKSARQTNFRESAPYESIHSTKNDESYVYENTKPTSFRPERQKSYQHGNSNETIGVNRTHEPSVYDSKTNQFSSKNTQSSFSQGRETFQKPTCQDICNSLIPYLENLQKLVDDLRYKCCGQFRQNRCCCCKRNRM